LNIFKHPAIRRFIYQILDKYKPNSNYKFATINTDYISKEIFVSGLYEKSLLLKLKHFTALENLGGTIIDVGANIGNHTVFFSEFAEKVIAFEPNPACFHLIHANTIANSCTNVEIIGKAVSQQIGFAEFIYDYQHTGGGTLEITEVPSSAKKIKVEMVNLDYYLDEIDNLTLLKIDTEGHENSVINGASQLLKRDHPIVVFEAHDLDSLNLVAGTLRENGYYEFYEITQSRRYYEYKVLNYLSYLFIPNAAKVSKILFDKRKGYQMVVAVKPEN